MERTFLDTNLLVYADDKDGGEKTRIAQAMIAAAIRSQTAVVSAQIIEEYFVVATRKLGVPVAQARRKVELLSRLNVVRIDTCLILEAIDLHLAHRIAFWDALVLRSAKAGGCARVLSEDLQHGTVLAGVRVENPFASQP